MRPALLMAAFCLVLFTFGCKDSKSNAETDVTEQEKKIIDGQVAQINLLPNSIAECCESLERLAHVADLAETQNGRMYAVQITGRHSSKVRELVQKFLTDRLVNSVSGTMIRDNYAMTVRRQLGSDWEVVSMDRTSIDVIPDGDGVRLDMTHTLSLRQHTGLFREDVFAIKRAKQSIIARTNCQGRPSQDVLQETSARIID